VCFLPCVISEFLFNNISVGAQRGPFFNRVLAACGACFYFSQAFDNRSAEIRDVAFFLLFSLLAPLSRFLAAPLNQFLTAFSFSDDQIKSTAPSGCVFSAFAHHCHLHFGRSVMRMGRNENPVPPRPRGPVDHHISASSHQARSNICRTHLWSFF